MTVITAQELTDMRAVADDFFPDTCTIQTRTESVDALGGIVMTWVNAFEAVACRIDPVEAGRQEAVTNLALEGKTAWRLNIPYDQAISSENRIRHNGRQYEVETVEDTHSYSTIRRALLIRVEPGLFTQSGFSGGFDVGFS